MQSRMTPHDGDTAAGSEAGAGARGIDGLDGETLRFCRDDVAAPWEQVLRVNRGEVTSGWVRPLLGFGPPIPVSLLPKLAPPIGVRLALGRDANMATVVLNRARNGIVYLAVERAESGRYVEMKRLDGLLPAARMDDVLHSILAGAEARALAALGDWLDENGFSLFRPAILKVADLTFFDVFAELAALQRAGKRRDWLRACRTTARRVLRERLVWFHPRIPFERVLELGRAAVS